MIYTAFIAKIYQVNSNDENHGQAVVVYLKDRRFNVLHLT